MCQYVMKIIKLWSAYGIVISAVIVKFSGELPMGPEYLE